MFRTLDSSQFKQLATQAKYITVYQEILADVFTPISVLKALTVENEPAILLESALKSKENGSSSFIGIAPYATFSNKNGHTTISTAKTQEQSTRPVIELLREFHKNFRCSSDAHSQQVGQMMGFLAYNAIDQFEKIANLHEDNSNSPDILFHFYKLNLLFDHESNKLLVALIVEVESDLERLYQNTLQEINATIAKIKQYSLAAINFPEKKTMPDSAFSVDCDDAQFATTVAQAKEFIQRGDVFQVVLSRTFTKPLTIDPLSVYRILRHSNPTPNMFYLTMPTFTLFGASPEKLVSVYERKVTIVPIAGTLPTDHQPAEILAQQLRDNEKQRAEHMMLVDLARNDIGRVCEPGSVVVDELMAGQYLTHVVHLVSYVSGKLAANYDAFDLLQAVFPAGTLSGAPKIRAMEIIAELEFSKRHLYGGAVCKIDAQGNLDSCIIIRSAVVENGIVKVRAGAGIVFDSDPAAEAAETRYKAKGVLTAVAQAEGANT